MLLSFDVKLCGSRNSRRTPLSIASAVNVETSILKTAKRHWRRRTMGSCKWDAKPGSRKCFSKYERNWNTACGESRRKFASARESWALSSSCWLFSNLKRRTSFETLVISS